jgi:hypothetical protein
MIVSASYRSDIPAFYAEWFRRRLAAGFASVVNPYGGPPYRVALAPAEVDGFVFWTRNVGPFLGVLDELHQAGRPFMLHFTITGYPRALEAGTVAARFGPGRLVWRYDPIVLSSLTPADFHRANFT